ncbi:MAG: DNA repair protein RecO [Alphaproteobacteria bacterium]|nr:DNA repair protein RecO [Alphaproteobacteria bacterium]
MNWKDKGIVLRLSKLGEYDAICCLLSEKHGKINGCVKGAFSKRMRPFLEIGSTVQAEYKTKSEEHLGYFKIEPIKNNSSQVLNHSGKLLAFKSAISIVDASLMYGQNHDTVFSVLESFFTTLNSDYWASSYCKWEISILAEMGIALDFSSCAGGGSNDLCYVSPKSGRAVSREMGQLYKAKLLPLPKFLVDNSLLENKCLEYYEAMKMSDFFLKSVISDYNKENMTEPRKRLSDWFFNRFDKNA